MITDQIRANAWDASKMHQVPLNLILGIITVESNGNPYRARFEPGWRGFISPDLWAKQCGITEQTERTLQAISWGLMQLMGANFRALKFDRQLPEVCDPRINTFYGALFLKNLMNKYAGDTEKVIVSYNAGSPRIDPETKQYVNQNYLDKVLAAMKQFPL